MVNVGVRYDKHWDTILLTKIQYYDFKRATKNNKGWFVFEDVVRKTTHAINLQNVLFWRVINDDF